MNPESIEARIIRLKALALDTATPDSRKIRVMSFQENSDLWAILDELHRLHEAVHKQRAMLERRKMKPKSLSSAISKHAERKHASGQPRTHASPPKHEPRRRKP